MWTFDQLQGLLDVRERENDGGETENGGLWVHNSVAPTMEVIDAVKLEEKHGKVKHIVGSVAIEHKIYSGPLAQYFLDADGWLPKTSWTFPVNVKLADALPSFRTNRNIYP